MWMTIVLMVVASSTGLPELDRAIALYEELEFEAARDVLVGMSVRDDLPAVDRAQIELWRGLCYLQLQSESPAMASFERAVELDPYVDLPRNAPPKAIEVMRSARVSVGRRARTRTPTPPDPVPGDRSDPIDEVDEPLVRPPVESPVEPPTPAPREPRRAPPAGVDPRDTSNMRDEAKCLEQVDTSVCHQLASASRSERNLRDAERYLRAACNDGDVRACEKRQEVIRESDEAQRNDNCVTMGWVLGGGAALCGVCFGGVILLDRLDNGSPQFNTAATGVMAF